MTAERLNRLEDEFVTVKTLLASAASYAESANRGLDRLTLKREESQRQIDQLRETQQTSQQQIDQLTAPLDALTVRVDRMSDRVDSFVFTAQHYFSQHSERINKLEGIAERLEGILSYLVRREGRGE